VKKALKKDHTGVVEAVALPVVDACPVFTLYVNGAVIHKNGYLKSDEV
jgi:hypothetical protein